MCFEDGLSASSAALDIPNQQMNDLSLKLESAKETIIMHMFFITFYPSVSRYGLVNVPHNPNAHTQKVAYNMI